MFSKKLYILCMFAIFWLWAPSGIVSKWPWELTLGRLDKKPARTWPHLLLEAGATLKLSFPQDHRSHPLVWGPAAFTVPRHPHPQCPGARQLAFSATATNMKLLNPDHSDNQVLTWLSMQQWADSEPQIMSLLADPCVVGFPQRAYYLSQTVSHCGIHPELRDPTVLVHN